MTAHDFFRLQDDGCPNCGDETYTLFLWPVQIGDRFLYIGACIRQRTDT